MSNNIAVIGDKDFISGFKALGCVLYPVDETTDLQSLLTKVIEENFLFIFILEKYALRLKDLFKQYSQRARPLIIPLSDFRADLSLTENLLSDLTVKAVGKDIMERA
jgi:V/A-type H+-transporting ATPase subunit F